VVAPLLSRCHWGRLIGFQVWRIAPDLTINYAASLPDTLHTHPEV